MRRKTGKGNIWRRITSFLQRKYLEKEKIFLEEKKNGEGKGGKCLDTEKNFWEEKKNGKAKLGKYLERKKYFFWRRRKIRKVFGEGNISFVEKKKNGEGTGLMDGQEGWTGIKCSTRGIVDLKMIVGQFGTAQFSTRQFGTKS